MSGPIEPPLADTFDRSCAHWSESGRAGMEHFYVLATEDYRQLAIANDWVSWLAQRRHRAGDRRLRLLDVACGSGKFPVALNDHAGVTAETVEPIDYDLLDPSAFSIAEARAALAPPFEPGSEYECRLQDLVVEPPGYDVVWATHALYALPAADLAESLARFAGAVAAGGAGVIAHACDDAHYLRFYRAYLDSEHGRGQTPYTGAEEIAATLDALNIPHQTFELHYAAATGGATEDVIEGYLQRCLFDDSLTLSAMRDDPSIGAYLERCRDGSDWHFAQHVKLIFFDR